MRHLWAIGTPRPDHGRKSNRFNVGYAFAFHPAGVYDSVRYAGLWFATRSRRSPPTSDFQRLGAKGKIATVGGVPDDRFIPGIRDRSATTTHPRRAKACRHDQGRSAIRSELDKYGVRYTNRPNRTRSCDCVPGVMPTLLCVGLWWYHRQAVAESKQAWGRVNVDRQ